MRRTSGQQNLAGNFFTNKDGSPIKPRILGKCFERLRRLAGVLRYDGASYRARMHDLRHTFAVHRISAWFKQDADMNRMLPALAAYMGQVGLGSAQRYLSLTPERFRKELIKLSPQRRKKRWRDDPALMKFLAEL
jgi:integrase/recombinase XerD